MILRLLFRKRFLKRFKAIDSTCDKCGRKIHDFIVDDEIWDEVIGTENIVLCYDCFCEECEKKGVFPVWKLEKLREE